jgi:uncharacterized membrane protein YjgN (DUF898 family)
MDFKAVIDLAKYTLTLTAACFVYSLEKLVPAPTELSRWLVLALLAVFTVSALAGIFILSAATAALHGDSDKAKRQEPRIQTAGYFHIGLLCLGVLLLGVKLVDRVLNETPPVQPLCSVPLTKP